MLSKVMLNLIFEYKGTLFFKFIKKETPQFPEGLSYVFGNNCGLSVAIYEGFPLTFSQDFLGGPHEFFIAGF